jgi:hypothetical protein
VLDYSGAFEDHVRDVDVVVDLVGGTTIARSWSVMRSGGILVAIAEKPDPGQGGRGDVRGVYFVVRPDGGQMRELATLVDEQQLRPAVSAVFELADLAKAFQVLCDATGILDDAYERLHQTGLKYEGWLSNHGPPAAEAMEGCAAHWQTAAHPF